MRLEDEIQQRKFSSEYHKASVNIIYTSKWWEQIYTKYFEEQNITVQQYNVLRILKGKYPNKVSVKEIREKMLDKMSDASRLVEKLRQKGMVKRQVAKDDRRNVEVSITEEGIKVLDALAYIEEKNKLIFSTLNEQEIKQLNDLMDKLRG